jgi:stage V sporulation protein R
MEDRGCYSFEYALLKDEVGKKKFNKAKDSGADHILKVRENFNDFTFINSFIDQEFVAAHNLFVAGKRFNNARKSIEYYIKSKKAEDYKEMLVDTLYHPPEIFVDLSLTKNGILYLNHKFETKPLKTDYIENTMIGIEYLWGGPVHLENLLHPERRQQLTPISGTLLPSRLKKKSLNPSNGKECFISWKTENFINGSYRSIWKPIFPTPYPWIKPLNCLIRA